MPLKKEARTMPILGSEFEILYYYYLCEDSGEQFTDTMLDDLNFNQLYIQYRYKMLNA